MDVVNDFYNKALGLNQRAQYKGFNEEKLQLFENPNNYNEYCRDFFSDESNWHMQYDYKNVIHQMEISGVMDEFLDIQDYIYSNSSLFNPTTAHDTNHTCRAVFFAEMLACIDNLPPRLRSLIAYAALFCDIGRKNDGKDPDHGIESVELIKKMNLLDGFDPRDKDIICFAIAGHSMGIKQLHELIEEKPEADRYDYRMVADYLTDVTKLERVRIANKGGGLNPSRLTTRTAKRLVKVAHQNYYQFKNLSEFERKINPERAKNDLIYKTYKILFEEEHVRIPIEDFMNIVDEYEEGTLEKLYFEGRVRDIISYSTFMKYGKPESKEAALRAVPGEVDLTFEGFLEDSKKVSTTELMPESLDFSFMLFYNCKKNHPDAYGLYLLHDKEIDNVVVFSLLSIININDIRAMRDAGYPFSVSDVIMLAGEKEIEEVRSIFDNKDYARLGSGENATEKAKEKLKKKLETISISLDDEQFFIKNFYYIDFLAYVFPEVLRAYVNGECPQYTLPELYAACTRIDNAADRLIYDQHLDGERAANFKIIPTDKESVFEYLKFFKQIDERQFHVDNGHFGIIYEVQDKTNVLRNPTLIQYYCNVYKPYEAVSLDDKVHYKRFSIGKILEEIGNERITLEEAKEKFLLAAFSFDVPSDYLKEFEDAFVQQLYYHKKYFGDSEYERDNEQVLSNLRKILESKSKDELVDALKNAISEVDAFEYDNLEALQRDINQHLIDVSKNDIIEQLGKTADLIDSLPYQIYTAADGSKTLVKVLTGQDFTIASTTLLPRCSKSAKDRTTKKFKSRNQILSEIRDYKYQPLGKCTSISGAKMLSRSAPMYRETDLSYGFVPQEVEQIGLSASYDLSTVRPKKSKSREDRVSKLPPMYIKVEDNLQKTITGHNETVMNAYPRYLFCYDEIPQVVLEEKNKLDAQYREEGITPLVQIVLIPAREVYIPRIKAEILAEHSEIMRKCNDNTFTLEDFDRMFGNREGNVVTRTIQALNVTTIKPGYNDGNFRGMLLESLVQVMGNVACKIPKDRLDDFEEVIQLIIDRGDSSTYLGTHYFNYNYSSEIPIIKLRKIQEWVEDGRVGPLNLEDENPTVPLGGGEYREE